MTSPALKNTFKGLCGIARAIFKSLPSAEASDQTKSGWIMRAAGILGHIEELLPGLQGRPGFGRAIAEVDTWRITLEIFKASNAIAVGNVDELFSDEMNNIPERSGRHP
ncbi:hypothetical protein BD410DRAFT_810517, partial [Rickenella mellea]